MTGRPRDIRVELGDDGLVHLVVPHPSGGVTDFELRPETAEALAKWLVGVAAWARGQQR